MKIIEITEKDKYNNKIKKQKHTTFLQSWEWGDFQKEVNHLVKRYGVYNNERLETVFSLFEKPLFLGKRYFYCPRWDFKNFSGSKNELIDEIKKIVKEQKGAFMRTDLGEEPVGIKNVFKKTIDVQPSKTRILDLGKSEDDLLREMHQKTRYNIRLASRKGVEIVGATLDNVDKYFEDFWKLMETTTERDNFRSHNKNYYRKMLDVPFTKLYLAKYGDKVLAGAIVSFFGDTSTYIHGASSNDMRNLMAPYLLQWEMIKSAKGRSCSYYDFYGVDELKWPGVTRFKKGFGGQEIYYAGTYDFIFCSVFYSLYSFLRKLRRMI